MPLLLKNKLVTINTCDDVGNIPSKGEMIDYEDKLTIYQKRFTRVFD